MTPTLTSQYMSGSTQMSPRIYEITVYRDGRKLGEVNPFLEMLDFSKEGAETTGRLLNRHLRGAALRDKAAPTEEHLYYAEGRLANEFGKGAGQPDFRWVLPTALDEEFRR